MAIQYNPGSLDISEHANASHLSEQRMNDLGSIALKHNGFHLVLGIYLVNCHTAVIPERRKENMTYDRYCEAYALQAGNRLNQQSKTKR